MKKHLLSFCLGAAVSLAAAGSASGEDYFQYWTELYLANMTGFDLYVTKAEWKGLDTNYPYVSEGDIISAQRDPAHPIDPTHVGKVSKWSAGVQIKLWFKLLGHEGSEDCFLFIDNPYSGVNTVTPKKSFPLSQCPSLVTPGTPDGSPPAPLYHNIDLPEHGHKLALVAMLTFQDLRQQRDFSGVDLYELDRQADRQMDEAEAAKRAFQRKFGIDLQ